MAPLVRDHSLFTQRWQGGLAAGRLATMPATIKVFTRTLATANHTTTAVETQLYSGAARVQPLGTPRSNSIPSGVAEEQRVRFQMPLLASALVPDEVFVRVTACALNPALVNGRVYVAKKVTDGSNPVETTLEAVADTAKHD